MSGEGFAGFATGKKARLAGGAVRASSPGNTKGEECVSIVAALISKVATLTPHREGSRVEVMKPWLGRQRARRRMKVESCRSAPRTRAVKLSWICFWRWGQGCWFLVCGGKQIAIFEKELESCCSAPRTCAVKVDQNLFLEGLIDSWSVGSIWEGNCESRTCSRDTYTESYITKYISIRG